MLHFPSHTIYLVKTDGTKENVMNCDCSTKREVKEEVAYLFDNCGYDKNKYVKAQYTTEQNKILYEFNLSELEKEN